LRAERLSTELSPALTLFEVAQASGISSYRLSIIERELGEPTPEELVKIREAIARLASERKP
jgi:transcriptional regulator with XRE-family HTH domain